MGGGVLRELPDLVVVILDLLPGEVGDVLLDHLLDPKIDLEDDHQAPEAPLLELFDVDDEEDQRVSKSKGKDVHFSMVRVVRRSDEHLENDVDEQRSDERVQFEQSSRERVAADLVPDLRDLVRDSVDRLVSLVHLLKLA
jgi:hypothetical protein